MAGPAVAEAVWGCVKCSQIGKTCCQRCEILVTAKDKRRIAEYTGRSDFWHDRVPTDPSYADQDDDPNWLKWSFNPDGSRPVLKRRADGDCGFLTPTGCSLPMEVRPLVCRLYPYSYTERSVDGIAEGCPKEVVPPGGTLLKILDMRLADAQRWHAMLYSELRNGKP